jgi:hypothetical protein
MTDVVQTTYGGWNCRGYTGFDIGNTRPDGKTVWIGDSSRVEFRTPCYIDAPTTVSSAAVLQAMFASELLLMSEAGDDELRDELATHAMDVFAASVGNSIRLFPMGDDGVPLSFDDTQALKEILTSNAHFIKNKRSTPEGKILLDSTSTYVNSIRRCAGQSAIRLAFS